MRIHICVVIYLLVAAEFFDLCFQADNPDAVLKPFRSLQSDNSDAVLKTNCFQNRIGIIRLQARCTSAKIAATKQRRSLKNDITQKTPALKPDSVRVFQHTVMNRIKMLVRARYNHIRL